jgi:hypothetical protein
MAEKVIAIKIDVQGTADQKKKIVGLELNLKKLTDQQKKLKKQVKDGVITNEQYAKSIAKVNLGLKGTRRQLLVTRQAMLGIDGFTTRLGKSFKKFGTSVSGAFVGLFAAQKLFQIMSDGVKTIKDFEQQMATVKAITGATGEEFLKLEKSAKDLGSSTQFTASQVGKLQEEFAKLGFSTQEILDASEATLDLATATGSDLAQAAEVAASTLNGFGLEAKDTKKVVDLMAESFSSTPLDINKFQESMKLVAPTAKAVGESIQDTTAKLGLLAKNGLSGSIAGTQLSRVFIELNKKGISLDEAMERVSSSTNKLGTATELVKDRGAKALLIFADQSKELKKLTNNFQDSAGAAKQMAAVVGDTLEGDLKRLSSAFEGLILGSAGTEFFRDLTQGATELISTLSDLTTNTHEESDALEDQRIKTNLLVQRILRLNEGSEERAKLVNELNVLNKDFLKNLDQENLSNEVLAKRLKEVNKQLVSQILIKREDEKLSEKAEDQADAEIDRLEAEADLEKQLLTIRESKFKGISEEVAIGKTQLEQAQELLKVLDEQSIRSRTQTSFGGSVESTNLQADAADKLRGIINSLSVANREVNEQNEEANRLAENREKLLKKLGIEENTNLEGKKKNILVNTNLIESEKELITVKAKKLTKAEKEAEKEAKRLEAENKRRLKAEERFLAKVDKLKKSSSLLAIEDEKKLQLEKLRLQKEGLEAEAKLKIQDKGKLDNTLLSLTNSFKLKEEEINSSFDKKDKEKSTEKKQKKIDDIIEVGQFALNSSSVLIDSIANIELQKEKEKLDNKLITEKEFAVLKYNIEKKAFERQKKVDIIQAIMNGALGVTKAFAQSGILGAITGAIVASSTAVQIASISKQKYPAASFADGGFTGGGSGIADETGFKQAGIVHEGEYVVPKHVLGTSEGSSLVGALENMRTNQPMPNLNIGYANGGMVSGGNIDLQGLENRMSKAITNSLSSIQVTNVATETTSQAIKVNNIEQEASFG